MSVDYSHLDDSVNSDHPIPFSTSSTQRENVTSRKIPRWAWKALVQILGIKLPGMTRVPCLSVILQGVTLLLACVFVVTGLVHTVYDIESKISRTTLVIGCSNIIIGFGWVCLGIYSQKLSGRLFSNRNFAESVRIHSRTFFKISAVGLLILLGTVVVVLNCYTSYSSFGPNNCATIFLHTSICHIMYASHVSFSAMSLFWNLLVGCVLLSVCRTHTMGLRKFIVQLERDSQYMSSHLQKTEPLSNMDLISYNNERDADWFVWDDDDSSHSRSRLSPPGRREMHEQTSVSSWASSSQLVRNNEQGQSNINTEQENVNVPETHTNDIFSERRQENLPFLSNDQILLCYWKISNRMRVTSTHLQRWMASWIAFVIIWCGDYIIFWISHHANVISILQFFFPLLLLLIITSAFAEANFEGQRMIRCICPTMSRMKILYFLNQQPLQMRVFNISISYNAILGVILAFGVAVASRIILDEVKI